MSLVIHNATVVTADEGRRVLPNSAIAIEGDRIVEIGGRR